MLNWAVGREYLDRTPFRRGTETLIRKLHEDNRRRRRISPDEEDRLLAVAPAHLRWLIIAALDSGMRRGEMLALRFRDVDPARGLITLRGETTKSRKTRVVPIATTRLRAVFEWLRLDADGEKKAEDALVFTDEAGEPLAELQDGLGHGRAEGARHQAGVAVLRLDGPHAGLSGGFQADRPALARPATRVRVPPGRAGHGSRTGSGLAGPRLHHDDRAVRQPDNREPAAGSSTPRTGTGVHATRPGCRAQIQSVKFLSRIARTQGAPGHRTASPIQLLSCWKKASWKIGWEAGI